MSRIRTIKPQFFRHPGLFDAERESGFPLRVAFAGLWTVADREGRFRWQPRELKLDCLPYDDVDFTKVLHALCLGGFIINYEVSGDQYGYIPKFSEHQILNLREPKSKIPGPSENSSGEVSGHDRYSAGTVPVHHLTKHHKSRDEEKASAPVSRQIDDEPSTPATSTNPSNNHGLATGTVPVLYEASRERERERERIGKDSSLRSESKKPKLASLVLSKKTNPKARTGKFKTEIDPDKQPEEAALEFALKAGMDSRTAGDEWAQFRDHHLKNRSRFADWPAAWRTWVRNWTKFRARAGPRGIGRSNGTEGFVKSVLENIENDRRRREDNPAKVVPMLQSRRE